MCKWLGASVACLLLLGSLLYTVSRLMPVPGDEADALTRLSMSQPLPGKNGSAAMWLLPYDVPEERAERLLAPEVTRFAATPIKVGEDASMFTLAFDSLPRLDGDLPDRGKECRLQEAGCLEKVRASLPEYQRHLEARKKISLRVAALDEYDYFRNPFASRLDTPFPSYQWLTRDLTVHAYAFIRGDVDLALEGVCRDASIARKLVASGDNLIGSMIGVVLMKGASLLFVEMLVELPADHPVPPRCLQVFRADGAMSSSICPTMLGEGRYSMEGLRSLYQAQAKQGWHPSTWFIDIEKTLARNAPRATWFCDSQANLQIVADTPLQDARSSPSSISLQCVANAMGCFTTDMFASGYAAYAWRLQDAEMRQKMVETWLWLRTNRDDRRPLAVRLASRPDALKSPAREIHIGEDGKALVAAMYETRPDGDIWRLPIPPWMGDKPTP